MKMAKASDRDIDAAGDLMAVLNAMSSGYYPTLEEPDDDTPTFFDSTDRDHLEHLHDLIDGILDRAPGMPGRVIGGMCYVILFDKNEIVDPDADVLELHPRIIKALREAEAVTDMRAALLEARAFIAEQRQCHVQCSTHPHTHELDSDDFEHAEEITNLLARIDAALGEGSKTWIE